MIRYILVLLALLMPSLASGQAYNTSKTVPAWSGSVDWTPPYTPDGPVPADAFEPAIIPPQGYTYSDWLTTVANGVTPSADGKWRTLCTAAFIKRADPILARGQYPALHDHTFIGANHPYVIENVQNFDYAMARNHLGSTCQGGILNGQLYWQPSMKDDRYPGFTHIPTIANFYYTHALNEANQVTRLRRGFAFITGANPANFNDTEHRAEYAAAGLVYPGDAVTPAGVLGYQCVLAGGGSAPVLSQYRAKANPFLARFLKGPGPDDDPWGGTCTAGEILVNLVAPACWDPNNLTSPNGREHVRHSTAALDNDPGPGQCPANFVKVMRFEVKVHYEHNGWADDLRYRYLSSDRMDPAMTVQAGSANDPQTQGDPASFDICRQTGPYFCNGATIHFDWAHGSDETFMETWQRECGGLTIGGVAGTGGECNDGTLSATQKLTQAIPPGQAANFPSLRSPITSTPPTSERAGAGSLGQKFFKKRPSDLSQPAVNVTVHGH